MQPRHRWTLSSLPFPSRIGIPVFTSHFTSDQACGEATQLQSHRSNLLTIPLGHRQIPFFFLFFYDEQWGETAQGLKKTQKNPDRSDFIAFCGRDSPLSSSPQSSSPPLRRFHLDLKCSWSHLIIFFVLALQDQRFMVWAVHSKIYFFAKALKCSKVSCYDGTSQRNQRPFNKMCRSQTFSTLPQFYMSFSSPWGAQLNMSTRAPFFLYKGLP